MIEIKLDNNEFLRQFEVKANGSLARIEYAEQERKIFLTKIIIKFYFNHGYLIILVNLKLMEHKNTIILLNTNTIY